MPLYYAAIKGYAEAAMTLLEAASITVARKSQAKSLPASDTPPGCGSKRSKQEPTPQPAATGNAADSKLEAEAASPRAHSSNTTAAVANPGPGPDSRLRSSSTDPGKTKVTGKRARDSA